jgi:hypothetical protein
MVLTDIQLFRKFYGNVNGKIVETIGEKRATKFFNYRKHAPEKDVELFNDMLESKGELRGPSEDLLDSVCRHLLEFEEILHQSGYNIEKVRDYLEERA